MRVVGLITIVLGVTLLRAWVLARICYWFLVPLGLPHVSLWYYYGAAACLDMLFGAMPKKHEIEWSSLIGNSIARSGVTLGVGWIIHYLV